uniref:S1 RNA-binding domain-containing protein n=1 Tax=Pseudomonas sp. TaxID=306 RepID=UPI00259111DA
NPWDNFAERHPIGSKVSGEIKNITEFGLFVGLEGDVDGMVHMSDLDWNRSGDEAITDFSKGQVVEAVVLDIDMEKERISLGIKQIGGDPFETAGTMRRGDRVTVVVSAVNDGGLEVNLGDGDALSAFIRRSDLSRDREDQRPERFNVGDKLDAMVTSVDNRARRIGLSIKALEIADEKEAVAQYGSSDSGASLGDILGAALSKSEKSDD